MSKNANSESPSLRTKILQGGFYLTLRQGLSVGLSFFGGVVLTRTIGPGPYGLYTAALSIFLFLSNISLWGLNIYLIRKEGEIEEEEYHQAFTLLLLLGFCCLIGAWLLLPLIQNWMNLPRVNLIAFSLFATLPLFNLYHVPLALIERSLDYKKVAWIEISGQSIYYLVAIPLAFRNYQAWAPVYGWWAQQLTLFALLYKLSGYRPRLYWSPPLIREMWSYGWGFSASSWVWQLRNLVHPLIVGRYAGEQALGYVALAIRLAGLLSFVKGATWRLSIAAFGKLSENKQRLANAVTEGMSLQVLALGPLLAIVSLLGPIVLIPLFGERWKPAFEVFPFIALGFLVNAMFNLHSSSLYVLRRNWEVTLFHIAHVLLFAGTAFWLVPSIGIIGYGWAELFAFASYLVLHYYVAKEIGSLNYQHATAWLLATAFPLFCWQLGFWTWLTILIPFIWPPTRHYLYHLSRTLWSKGLSGEILSSSE